jgi:hypothetical protein
LAKVQCHAGSFTCTWRLFYVSQVKSPILQTAKN